jgi:hypothetical protein
MSKKEGTVGDWNLLNSIIIKDVLQILHITKFRKPKL